MVSLIAFMLASMIWAVMNTHTFHHSASIFASVGQDSFWGVNSWVRKYDSTLPIIRTNWYYRTFKIIYKEHFPGSATIFVWLTDGYHLTQFFFLWAITISVVTCPYEWPMEWHAILVRALLLRGVWWIGFNAIFTLLKK